MNTSVTTAVGHRTDDRLGHHIAASVTAGGLLFTAGLVSPRALGGEPRRFAEQVDDVLAFLDDVLAAQGLTARSVIRVEAFLADRADHPGWDAAFRAKWPERAPARTTLALTLVPAGIVFELQATAYTGAQANAGAA
ncbi:RidA family protein [Streptomyces sp. NPDC004838]